MLQVCGHCAVAGARACPAMCGALRLYRHNSARCDAQSLIPDKEQRWRLYRSKKFFRAYGGPRWMEDARVRGMLTICLKEETQRASKRLRFMSATRASSRLETVKD